LLHGEEEIERRLNCREKRERERGSLTLVLELRVEKKQGWFRQFDGYVVRLRGRILWCCFEGKYFLLNCRYKCHFWRNFVGETL